MSKKKRYPVRIPRFAAGIRAQGGRSGSVRSWWDRRFLAALEGMGLGGRFARGRNYAISGQVLSLRLEGPLVSASVLGGRPAPYSVAIRFRAPEGDARARIVAALRSEPMLVARLLADDLPLEVESVFRAEGFSLFPGGKLGPGRYDATTECSCPDWANPCKHSAAVLLLLCEECARRPMTLLELRGIFGEDLTDED
ncbi:MAG: SWIM zinc finger family protein [Kiritimatiellae bacterium]|nr:SWIM zinc finger family protein [Kiritimatiellia bacterium]